LRRGVRRRLRSRARDVDGVARARGVTDDAQRGVDGERARVERRRRARERR
jgi:hypothetical protein